MPPLQFNNKPIPVHQSTKYLGITLDKRLTWSNHTKQKRKQLNSRLHLLRPLLKSNLSLKNKLLLYKVIIRPVWSYGIQIWGPAKPANIHPIQAFQSITLRLITGAPWYITNAALHNDLKIQTVNELAKSHYKSFHSKLTNHINPFIQNMSSLTLPQIHRRLKRNWSRDILR